MLYALTTLLAATPTLATIRVPAEMAKVTTPPELSGLAWAAPLERWLVVSDDTGRGSNKHAPELLAMSAAGELDATPVPITGIDTLDDPESICAGPPGTWFLVTSHSMNKKGKLPKARRQLLELKLAGRSLAVVRSSDLTTALGTGIDVEAVAWHDGALFVGLKAPEAAVYRLDAKGGAEKVTTLDLDGQGISDLLFLPDGAMVVAANTAKGMPPRPGALWRVPAGGKPELLVRFAAEKPEGLALDPKTGALVVVFDTDRATPRWAVLDVR